MPFATRSTEVTKVGYSFADLDSLAVAANLSIGNTLLKRGWSYSRCTSDSADTVGVVFNRRGERDRDFTATTAVQWSQLEQRFAVAARKLGWSSDVVAVVKERATVGVAESLVAESTANPLICLSCGCENYDTVVGNCFVCGASRETVTVALDPDSELRKLIATVKSAVAALETYLENR